MPSRLSILRRSKRVEQEVSDYFWPDQEPDETGSRRDWKELWDISGLGFDGEVIICEVKSVQWPSGTGSLWTLLDKAYTQARDAAAYYHNPGQPHVVAMPVVIFKPAHTSIEDAICYLRCRGQMVVMPASQFKQHFIEGDSDGD